MKTGLVLAVALCVAAAFAVPGLTATGPTQTGLTADAIGSPGEHSGAPGQTDGFTYTIEWVFSSHHAAIVGLTPVQDTLLWVSSGGSVTNGDTNMILVYNLNTRTLVDTFKQFVQAPTSTWGYRDMAYDPVENMVYAGYESNKLHKINATAKTLAGNYTVSGSGLPSIVRALGYDGDSLFAANFTSVPVSKFSKTGTNCHQVAPIPPLALYGLAIDNAKTYAYGTTADYSYMILRHNYTSGNWTVKDSTYIAECDLFGGCETWRNDTFLLVIDQTSDRIMCLRLIAGVTNDVGVNAVLAPPAAMTPGTVAPKAQIRNFGTAAQSGFPVSCWIDSGATRVYNQTATFSGSLPGGGIDSIAFPNWTSGPAGAQYKVTMFTNLTADQNRANDTAFKNVTISGAVFSETIHVRRLALDAPTIDGVISPGEWSASVWYDISDIANRAGSGARPAGSAYMYFLYDSAPGFIYMACDVPPVTVRGNYDQIGPYIDENHSHSWSTDSSEGNHWLEYVSADSLVFRALLNTVPNAWRMPGQCPGAVSAMTTTSGHLQIEGKIPLGPLKGDLTVGVGDTVGYFMYMAQAPGNIFWGWWPQSLLMANWANPTYYGHMIFDSDIVGTEERPQGTLFALDKVAPTLARGSGRISYYVGTRASVGLRVYDGAGKLVRTLADGVTEPGMKTVVWDRTDNAGARVAAGTYFYRLVVDGKSVSAKTILLD